MFVVSSYLIAVVLCVITMVCWGSWANTQKLATKQWAFQLYYWDYGIGVLLISFILAITMGSTGDLGRSFFADLSQGSLNNLGSAFLGGVLFNLANILLVAAIDIAGMAVAFPVAIGLALVIGVIVNYLNDPIGDPILLFAGVICVAIAMIVAALAYKRHNQNENTKSSRVMKGLIIALVAGVLMGFFYRFVIASMAMNFAHPESGYLTPYTANFIFALGLVISSFIFNTWVMKKPFSGSAVNFSDYFKGSSWLHFIGILGGAIWGLGSLLNFVASETAGAAISYGLGQGATLIAAFWGVFIWKEFKSASTATNYLLALMFTGYIVGLSLIIIARVS